MGHISNHCRSNQPVCVRCGTRGHRKGDNRCGRRRVCCANCRESHPSSYRGCIAFLREKEALKLRASEKTPLFNARRLAKLKDFPHLNRAREAQQTPPSTTPPVQVPEGTRSPSGSQGYASVVTAGRTQQQNTAPSHLQLQHAASAPVAPISTNAVVQQGATAPIAFRVPLATTATSASPAPPAGVAPPATVAPLSILPNSQDHIVQTCHRCTCDQRGQDLEKKLTTC